MKRLLFGFLSLGVAAVIGMGLAGCPCPQTGETRVIALLTTGAGAKADVPIGEIERFLVTITSITFDEAGSAAGKDEEAAAKAVVFEGSQDVDLVNLREVSAILSDVEIPAGDYRRIRLSIENPRLFLAAAPEEERTDVHLNANGRLFITEDFTLEAGQTNLILLDLGGLKLVQLGNGSFTFTPQLAAAVEVVAADVVLEGVITAVDAAAERITVATEGGDFAVAAGASAVALAGEMPPGSGSFSDLSAGQNVRVTGRLFADGSVAASQIEILQ